MTTGVFDAGDDPDGPAAVLTGLDIDVEDALQALCLWSGGVALGGCFLRLHGEAFAASGRGHRRAQMAVGHEHAVEAGEKHAGFGHQGGKSGNKIQWLEYDVRGALAIGGVFSR